VAPAVRNSRECSRYFESHNVSRVFCSGPCLNTVLMIQLKKVLYTAKTRTSGGREGVSRSSDGRLDVRLASPGTPQIGTNPEQLLAAGWSASFISALKVQATRMQVALPPDLAIDAEIDLGVTDGALGLTARLNVTLPGLARPVAQNLIDAAQQVCPYSRATDGNVHVTVNLTVTRTQIASGKEPS
jgi:osmotically inducible protein OsmC